MNLKLIQFKENIYEGFWFIPVIVSLGIISIFFFSLYGDYNLFDFFPGDRFLQLEKTSVTTIFSIIATAMVGIISVTFSITVLTLSIASNQLGQRLLPHFMKQKQTQIIMGFYTGAFIYALLIILSFSVNSRYITPSLLSAKIGIIIGVLSVFMLVYFIHFVCHSIQIDNILLLLTNDIKSSIRRQFKNEYPNAVSIDNSSCNEKNSFSKLKTISILAKKSGYIQAINFNSLIASAKCYDLVLKVHVNPGEFVFDSTILITAYKNDPELPLEKAELHTPFEIGIRRTPIHDTGFAFEQISEIALRALSPGVNAPFTAVHCINQMLDGFTAFIDKKPIPRLYKDNDNKLRLITNGYDFKQIVDDCFDKIRQAASGNILVSVYLIKAIHSSLLLDHCSAMKAALFNQASMTFENIISKAENDNDKNDIKAYFEALKEDYKKQI